jgi:aminocarboxymuconate-semialdehyde decarboxylase
MKIDLHAHFLPRDCFNMTDKEGRPYGHITKKNASGLEELEGGNRLVGGGDGMTIADLCDPEKRIRELDSIGLDMQVISVSPPNISYKLDPQEGLLHAKKYNDGIAEVVRAYPDRFGGMSTVPMQDVSLATAEMERAFRQLGFRAVQILTEVNGKNLDEKVFWPFFQKAQDLDILIYVHPSNGSPSDGLNKYWLRNLIGNPYRTSIAIASVVFGGVMESFPRLKLLFSHSGGFAPYVRGRWERGYNNWEVCHSTPKPPSEYLKLLYFDNIALYGPALAYLVDTVGPYKVVLGTDAPGIWHPDPITPIRNAAGISAKDKEIILEKSAAALINIAV